MLYGTVPVPVLVMLGKCKVKWRVAERGVGYVRVKNGSRTEDVCDVYRLLVSVSVC